MEGKAVKQIRSEAGQLRRRVASKSKSLDLFDRPPARNKASIGLPRHRSMAAMPMMASIPEDSSFRDWVGEEEQVAHRSPVSLDNGYRPTAQNQKSNHDYDHNSNHNHIYNHEQPHLNQQWQTRGSLQLEPSTFNLQSTSSSSKTRAANIERSGHNDDSMTLTSWPPQLLLRRQRSVEISSAAEEENKGRRRVIGEGEKDKRVSENIGRLEETEGRKETSKKRTKVSTSSLPPVWHLVPVTCLYLLLLLLLHLLSPLLTNLPTFPSTSPPSTCDVYNQSIARHSSL